LPLHTLQASARAPARVERRPFAIFALTFYCLPAE
jgi:hypothetical protein